MEKLNSDEFYFIYIAVGPTYIKPIIHNFSTIPSDINVVILTNTPKLLENLQPHFNLIVADLNILRDDWSKENEKILDIDDEDEYLSEFIKLNKTNYTFPIQIMRFGIKWAAINNITKFAIMESGMVIGFDQDPHIPLNKFKQWGETKNVLFGNTFWNEYTDDTLEKYLIIPAYRNVIENYGIDLNNYPSTFTSERSPYDTGSVGFEGGIVGFWFHDVLLVEMCFNIYTDLIKTAYENGYILPYDVEPSRWSVNFEWVMTIIISIYTKYFNTIVVGHQDITTHFLHPEDAFFMASEKYRDDEWINTTTRDEFLKLNRNKLIQTFTHLERAKKLIYGFE
jgi:hypothetical protein